MRDRLLRLAIPGLFAVLATAVVVGLMTAPPRPVDRVDALAARLRCPVCQSESVADSPSDTARQMREQIAGFVADGRSDAWILDHYVQRYGRWILLDPPMGGATLVLWLLPPAALVAGVVIVLGRRRGGAPPPSSAADRVALARAVAERRAREGLS